MILIPRSFQNRCLLNQHVSRGYPLIVLSQSWYTRERKREFRNQDPYSYKYTWFIQADIKCTDEKPFTNCYSYLEPTFCRRLANLILHWRSLLSVSMVIPLRDAPRAKLIFRYVIKVEEHRDDPTTDFFFFFFFYFNYFSNKYL